MPQVRSGRRLKENSGKRHERQQSMNQVSLTIDGQQVSVPPGTSVLQAALDNGIFVPTLCHDPRIEPYGGCRMCIVEIEGMRGLPTACTTPVAHGMIVRTDTAEVNEVRRMTCSMLISDHRGDCLSCWSNQQCGLQKTAAYLGIEEDLLRRMDREAVVDESNPFYIRDLSRCILCDLCVRVCAEIRAVYAIATAGRGYESRIAAFSDDPVYNSVCDSCGECVDVCPVGALVARRETVSPAREVRTICPYCGCGCGIVLGLREGRIVSVRGDKDNPVNAASLCVKGRFGLDFVNAHDRLKTPLIKRNGKFEEASWDEALDLIASRLGEIRDKHGPDAIAGWASAKCTNEENYLFQKLLRAGIGTNNVDHCARLCHASTVAGLSRAFGSGAMTNSVHELQHADCILVTGSNTTEAHPIVALRIKAAVKKHGAKLILADPRRIDLSRFATLHLRQRSGTDVALFNAMMQVIIAEGLANEAFMSQHTEGFEELSASLAGCTPEWAEPLTGVAAEDIRAAARAFARAERGSIVYSMGITQHSSGTDNVLALANLAMLTGHIGRLSTGVNPLRGQNNVQGSCDMGALPNVYPGYQPAEDSTVRARFEQAWNVPLPDNPGLTITEAVNAAHAGDLKAVHIMGENPMLSDPNLRHVREALESLEFLCVQDIFLSETAQLAHVVLPTASFAEKDGTFTNTERRVQRVRKALDPPGEARQDWEILCGLAGRFGLEMAYENPAAILQELTSLTPIYGGISFERIDKVGLQWPCPDESHPGTLFLHEGGFTRGKGRFHPVSYRRADELPDAEFPYLFTTGRILYQYHTGTMTRRTPGLEEIAPPAPFEIHPEDAAREGIAPGETVELSSRRGTIRAQAFVTDRVPVGTIFMSFHYREAAANMLTNDALDPVAKIPEFKVCAVRLKKS